MRIAAIASGLALLGLAGCAADKDGGVVSMATCTANPCPATVTVTVQGGKCTPQTNPKRLEIPAGNKNDIVWTLNAPAGFKFQNNGVEFKAGSGGGFSSGGGGGGTRFVYHNNHSKTGDHLYNVNVTNGAISCTEDPTIVNH